MPSSTPAVRWIPNAITMARVALVPVWLYFAIKYRDAGLLDDFKERIPVILTFGAIGLSDAVDGIIARHFGSESPLGAILDAAADKLAQMVSVIFLVFFGAPAFEPLPLWLLAALVIRDVLLATGWAFLHHRKRGFEATHRWHGRASTFFLFALILAVNAGVRGPIVVVASALVVLLIIPSTIAYLRVGWRELHA